MNTKKMLLRSSIVLYFVIAFEVLIMISPFAGFFYSAFNPVLLGLAKYPETRWLSSFFFTHLLVPPNDFLKFIRIMGSVLFVLGMVVFLICALQVYTSKFFKTGPALKGLLSRLSWKWRKRSSVKIAERTYEKRAQALHCRREGGHSTTPSFRQGPGFRSV